MGEVDKLERKECPINLWYLSHRAADVEEFAGEHGFLDLTTATCRICEESGVGRVGCSRRDPCNTLGRLQSEWSS